MRIEHLTKFRCDGCGREDTNPFNWVSVGIMAGGQFRMVTGPSMSEDYCADCIAKMRAVVKAA